MADNTREIVKAIDRMNREVCKMLNDMGRQLNKAVGGMAEALEQKQFDEWTPPEPGTAIQNLKGCVMMNAFDFAELMSEGDTDCQPKPLITEENQMTWQEYEEENK